jgi:Rieske Fe-S protein
VTRQSERDLPASRRGVLAGGVLAGIAGTVSACGLLGSSSGGDPGNGAGAGAAGGAASALGMTSDIPVGGGKVFFSAKVVVTQPAAGTFKAFSAVCTHQQCTVDQVSGGTIDCPCHGSQFSVKDGSVVSGPASSPLPAAPITVTGTSIELG